MRIPPKRCAAWTIALIALLITVRWCFFYPYDVDLLYRVIPRNAAFISQHDQLGRRWPGLVGSPHVAQGLAVFAGMDDAARAGLTDPWVLRTLGIIGKRPVLVAHVPTMGRAGASAWLAVGWAGGATQWLRFGWLDGALRDMAPCPLPGTACGWRMAVRSDGRTHYLGLVALEGVLAACYSEDPMMIHDLAERMRRRGHGELQSLAPGRREWLQSGAGEGADRLYGGPSLGLAGLPGVWLRSVGLDRLDAEGLQAHAQLHVPLATLEAGRPPSILERLPEAFAAALLVTSPSNLVVSLSAAPGDGMGGILKQAGQYIDMDNQGFLGLTAQSYSGSLMGVPIPAVVGGVRLKPPTAAHVDADLRECCAMLNAKLRLGIRIVPSATTPGLYTIAPLQRHAQVLPGRSGYASLAVWDGWLLVSSDEGVLARLLGYLHGSGAAMGHPAPWSALEPCGASAAALWIEGERFAWVLERSATAYGLLRIIPSYRRQLPPLDRNDVGRVVAFVRGSGQTLLAAESEEGLLRLRLRGY